MDLAEIWIDLMVACLTPEMCCVTLPPPTGIKEHKPSSCLLCSGDLVVYGNWATPTRSWQQYRWITSLVLCEQHVRCVRLLLFKSRHLNNMTKFCEVTVFLHYRKCATRYVIWSLYESTCFGFTQVSFFLQTCSRWMSLIWIRSKTQAFKCCVKC